MDSSSGSKKRKLDDRQPPGQSHVSSNASHTPEGPRSYFDQIHESPTACASPQQITNAMVTYKMGENEKAGNDFDKQFDFGYVSSADKMSLQDIAAGSVDEISAKMDSLTDASIEEMLKELIVILEGNGDSQKWKYLMLQNLVLSRTDLTATALSDANRSQLEILVAIKTESHAFLQRLTSFSFSKTSLIEIFEQKRCRKVECQILLPAKNCVCRTCATKKGFCNICMCIICNKYEFKVNSCPLSCDMCSHKIHMDCAMGNGVIGKSKACPSKLVFRCQDCSELIDLMIGSLHKNLDREALINEFNHFSMILRGKDNPGQRELFCKCEDLKEKMKNGTRSWSKEIFMFYQGLSMDAPKSVENGEGGKLIAPQEASNQIAEVETKMIKDIPCSSERALVLEEEEEEEEEEEHATPETEVIEEGKTSGQTEVEAPNNPDGVWVEEVQPLEQLQQPVDADGTQPEPATRDGRPSSPNSSSNLRSSTLLHKFPPIPSNLPGPSFSNSEIPNLPFNGTYSSSKDTMEANTPEQQQILAEFFHTHPTVQTRIESYSEVLRNPFSKRLATLLRCLQFVRLRDFDEATRAEVQVAWIDLTNAGFELQDLQPAVNRALNAKIREEEEELAKLREKEEELTTTVQALQREIQACQAKLDNPPLYNSNDH